MALVHPRVALLHSLTEMLFAIHTMIGNRDSRAEFAKHHEKWANSNLAKRVKEIIRELKVPEACERLMEFKMAGGRGLPWFLKKEACLVLHFSRDGYVFPTPSDHKDIAEILEYMSYLSQKGLLPREEEEKKTLSLIISLILNGNFEGRLRGLNELKKIVDYNLRTNKKEYLTVEIQRSNLLAFLTDNKNFNPELFKRSVPVFQYCYQHKLLQKKDLTRILGLHKDKHELEVKSFYATLAEFPTFLDKEMVVAFFNEITQNLPLDEFTVNLVKDYTLTALSKSHYFRTSYCKEGLELGVTYYWKLVFDAGAGAITTELKYRIMEAFGALLSDLYYTKEV